MGYRDRGVQVDGLKELRKTLKAAGDDLSDLKAANAEAAQIAADGGRSRVPTLNGLLASSIRSTGTKTAGIVRAGKASVPYAAPIHWGWPARSIPENPFLSDGATATEPRWLPVYEQRIEDIINNVEGI